MQMNQDTKVRNRVKRKNIINCFKNYWNIYLRLKIVLIGVHGQLKNFEALTEVNSNKMLPHILDEYR